MKSVRYPDLSGAQTSLLQHTTKRLVPKADTSRRASTGSVTLHTHRDPSPAVFHVPGSYPPPVSSQERSVEPADEREYSDEDEDEDEGDGDGDGDGDGPASCPPTPQRGSQSISANLKAFITKKAGGNPLKHKTGEVYIFIATHNGIPIIKIGSSANSVETRKKSIRSTCTVLNLQATPIDLPAQPITSYLTHVERLAQIELQDFRYDFDCSCKTQHREWFAVDPAVAHRVVGRWIRFCNRRPWDCHGYEADSTCTGRLKPYWRDHLDHCMSGLTAPAAARELETQLGLLDRFADVTLWVAAWDDAKRWSGALWQYVWQASLVLVLMAGTAYFQTHNEPWVALSVLWLLAALLLCVTLKVGGFRCWMAELLRAG